MSGPVRLVAGHSRALMAALIFASGVLADVAILNYLHTQPRRVSWQNGDVQTNYINQPCALPAIGTKVELGMTDDGSIVWRVGK